MSYFSRNTSGNKTLSDVESVFSIFLGINDSSDYMEMSNNIILAIKKYRNRDFNESDVDLLSTVSDKIFGNPSVPNMNKPEPQVVKVVQENKFAKKYPI
jgi:hypothetical protein